MRTARTLIIAGGWEGHKPLETAALFSAALGERGHEVRIANSLDILTDAAELAAWDLIFPCWTMGTLTSGQTSALLDAVRGGVGLGGIHGGMGDAFRGNLDYEWAVGGHFVGHPHVGGYEVRLSGVGHEITQGLPARFAYHSEQYYMMVDPGITVLAETDYEHDGARCAMPVAWVKQWGRGRVFYSSLGHDPAEFGEFPEAMTLALNGLKWAARRRSQ